MFSYLNGKSKFKQNCLESYAKKLGLYTVEPGSFQKAVQYFIKMTVVSIDVRLHEAAGRISTPSLSLLIYNKKKKWVFCCFRSPPILTACFPEVVLPSFHYLGPVPHSLLPSDLGSVATFSIPRP